MNDLKITTKIELENSEVEQLLDVSFIYGEETIWENVIQTCVEGLKSNKTNEFLNTEEAMEQLFAILKANYIVPAEIDEFSYEMYTCERIKNYDSNIEMPKKLIITYSHEKLLSKAQVHPLSAV